MSADALSAFRAAFPVTRERAYFQSARRGPLPSRTVARLTALLEAHSRFGGELTDGWFEQYQTVRGHLAAWLGTNARNLAFSPNTSHGIALIANGLDWHAGDEVVIPAIEYPANVYAWMMLERFGVTLRKVPPDESGRVSANMLLAAIGPKTRLVSASHVSFVHGYRMDIRTLAQGVRRAGVLCVIDAAQSVGWARIDFDEIGCDALIGVSRKFLCGLDGLGHVLLRDEMIERLRPSVPGPFSVKHADNYLEHRLDWRDDAWRFVSGAIPTPQVYALEESLALFATLGQDAIQARALDIAAQVRAELARLGFAAAGEQAWSDPERSAILLIPWPNGGTGEEHAAVSERMTQALAKARVSATVRPQGLRLSTHAFNDESDVKALVDALAKSL